MKSVSVLMSTYNGEFYIKDQLDSILNQEGVKVKIYIRDDGSTDKTVEIIKLYQKSNNNITLLEDGNIGATKSFYRLSNYINNSEIDFDFYAFADQDDIWHSDKLSRAVNILERMNNDKPNLYYSNLNLYNDTNSLNGKLLESGIVKNTKEQSLAQIFTYGCTCVFNKEALNKFCRLDESKDIYHDNWIYLVCKFLGNTYYDEESYIKYRQHDNNLSGKKNRGFKLFIERLKKMLNYSKLGNPFEKMSKNMIELFYEDLSEEDIKLICTVANYRNSIICKLRLLFSNKIVSTKPMKNLCIKVRVLINKV